jgi:TatD DNase family protein
MVLIPSSENRYMKLVDAHCHLVNLKKDYQPSGQVMPVTVGFSHSSNQKTVPLAKKLNLPYVLGIAPQTAIKSNLSEIESWEDFIRKSYPNAIGEIGLDYHWAENEQDRENEKVVFARMLDLAEEMEKPIVLHARDAVSEVLDFLELRSWKLPFMMHFFSGTLAEARRVVEMGGLISITALHSKKRKSIIKSIGVEHMVVETDAPYVGRTPEDVTQAIEYICEVRELDQNAVARITSSNAARFFGIWAKKGDQ